MLAPFQQRGFSLIEILITLIITAVGVLGMLALQTKAVGYSVGSAAQTQAIILVDDLIETMRNHQQYIYDDKGKLLLDSPFYKSGSQLQQLQCEPLVSSASSQLGCWVQQLSEGLPGVDKRLIEQHYHICRSNALGTCSAEGSLIEVQVAWPVTTYEECDQVLGNLCVYRVRIEV